MGFKFELTELLYWNEELSHSFKKSLYAFLIWIDKGPTRIDSIAMGGERDVAVLIVLMTIRATSPASKSLERKCRLATTTDSRLSWVFTFQNSTAGLQMLRAVKYLNIDHNHV